MRVVIQFEPDLRPLLAAWQGELSPNPLDRQLLADTYLNVFRRRLVQTGGRPDDGVVNRDRMPPEYWYPLAGDVWLGYVIESTGTLIRRERRIRVTGLRRGRPPEGSGASPRS
jgi:hypothetical protein